MGDASATITVEPFPFGKRFAVTMIDDTDLATHAEIEPVYACLDRSGIRITKTVWPLPAVAPSGPGTTVDRVTDTLANQEYTRFCQRLQSQGFEIAMHTASGGNDTRDRTIQAYDLFERVFGHPPKTNIMHGRIPLFFGSLLIFSSFFCFLRAFRTCSTFLYDSSFCDGGSKDISYLLLFCHYC